MRINYPKNYYYKIIFERLENDPIFKIVDNKISFLLYYNKYHPVTVTFFDEYCEVLSDLSETLLDKEVSRIFDLNTNFSIVKDSINNSIFKNTLDKFVGYPLCLDVGLYESLFRNIIHQQVSMKGAYTLTKRILDTYGERIGDLQGFPRPEVLASLSIENLRDLKINTKKCEYLIDTAKMIVDGILNLEEVSKLSADSAINHLVKIRGIGRWTAHCFLLFGAGNKDLFIRDDLGVTKAIQIINNSESIPDKIELDLIESSLSVHKSYITYYLWYKLINKKE